MKTVNYTSHTLGADKASELGKVFAGIARSGELTPERVVAAAANEKSPLHRHFCWADNEAARRYRLLQAASLIRTVKVRFQMPTKEDKDRMVTVRAFVSVSHGQNGDSEDGCDHSTERSYVPIQRALRVKDFREQMKAEAAADMKAFRNKYAVLCELEDVFAAMTDAERKLAERKLAEDLNSACTLQRGPLQRTRSGPFAFMAWHSTVGQP